MESDLWPMQERGIAGVVEAAARGVRRLCLTAPTGCGKSRTMRELVRLDLEAGRRAILYTNRRLLLEQTAGVFADLLPGIRAAGHLGDPDRPFQIASVQTENARELSKERPEVFPADRVYFDEGHLMTGDVCNQLVLWHRQGVPGCVVCYVTATPVGMGAVADELVVAGTTSEGRKCGALVPAYHYGPSEPWVPPKLKSKLERGEDLSETEQVKAIMRPGIFGLVFDNWKRLNPEGGATVLFGPGVDESRWFAQEFAKRGVSAAHIDGDYVWVNGKEYPADRKARDAVLEQSRTGDVKVVCNRYVLREGIDAPWLRCGILACVFGSLQGYLQAGGRFLRKSEGKDRVAIIDHGGNWWRHGSLNADRHWDLSVTPAMMAGERADRLREKAEAEPLVCPTCRCVLARMVPGSRCPECGHELPQGFRRSRPVMMEDGSLSELRGDIYLPKVREARPTTALLWSRSYFQAKNSGFMTFKQAEGLFFRDHGYWPPLDLKFMPKTSRGWYLRVCDTPKEDLH